MSSSASPQDDPDPDPAYGSRSDYERRQFYNKSRDHDDVFAYEAHHGSSSSGIAQPGFPEVPATAATPPLLPPGDASSSSAAAFEAAAAARKEKGRVRFNSGAAGTQPPAMNFEPSPRIPERRDTPSPGPRPSILRANSSGSVATTSELGIHLDNDADKAFSAAAAQERANKIAARVLRDSPPGSRASLESHADTVASDGGLLHHDEEGGIPMRNLGAAEVGRVEDSTQQTTPDNEEEQAGAQEEAYDIVRSHTRAFTSATADTTPQGEAEEGGASSHVEVVPSNMNGGWYDGVYNVPPPEQYRGSVLSQLLRLYKPTDGIAGLTGHGHGHKGHLRNASSTSSLGGWQTPPSAESGSATPLQGKKKWYENNRSQETLSNLVAASAMLANPNKQAASEANGPGKKRPGHKRRTSSSRFTPSWQKEEVRITVHIAETLSRQGYIIKLCRALMLFGAPTHRLEEYLTMTARVLEIDGQFLYLPGCMLVSFDDRSTHTTEVRIVRTTQGIDLGKLKDVHHIYKEVMHDVVGVEEGTRRLDELMTSRNKFRSWTRVLVFGLTSVTCAPFSFSARLIDLPILFCFGALVGLLQIIVAPKSNMYSNVFEVTATIVVSFLARAFGSIRGGELFCFSALAQGGIVMLLPGFSVCKLAVWRVLVLLNTILMLTFE